MNRIPKHRLLGVILGAAVLLRLGVALAMGDDASVKQVSKHRLHKAGSFIKEYGRFDLLLR